MELFTKSGNWRQICKQTSSTFYTLNDLKLIERRHTPLRNSFLITYKKNPAQPPEELRKKAFPKNFAIFTGKQGLEKGFFNSEYCEIY